MPRPRKWRRVEFIPDIRRFIPMGVPGRDLEENILKVEELEALRLKTWRNWSRSSVRKR